MRILRFREENNRMPVSIHIIPSWKTGGRYWHVEWDKMKTKTRRKIKYWNRLIHAHCHSTHHPTLNHQLVKAFDPILVIGPTLIKPRTQWWPRGGCTSHVPTSHSRDLPETIRRCYYQCWSHSMSFDASHAVILRLGCGGWGEVMVISWLLDISAECYWTEIGRGIR